jgi:hypothetical protein
MTMKTAKRTRVMKNKANFMSDEAFADLNEALVGALAFERGEHRELLVTRIPAPDGISRTLIRMPRAEEKPHDHNS